MITKRDAKWVVQGISSLETGLSAPRLGSALAAILMICAIALGNAGCGFQPLYGSGTITASGARLSEVMSSVEVQPVPGRVGQKVRNELIFSNTGGGYAAKPKYKLRIILRESLVDQLVQISGDARGQVLELTASFQLIDAANGQEIYQGSAVSRAALTRYQEVFANTRAIYDAQNRAAREVAKAIQTQVAAALATSA